jgi:RNA polymerase sigma-70 factor (ECF subfamily)
MAETQSEITCILDRWSAGDPDALGELIPLIVDDLRRLARQQLAREDPGHTLQPTALVNEVYLRLAGRRTVTWRNRAQFFAFMASLMRRILVDHARHRQRAKRGSGSVPLSFDESLHLPDKRHPDLLALDDALNSLAEVDPRKSRIVELRYFAGLTVEEVAEVEGLSPTTVKRHWRAARLWLLRELERE